METKLNNWKPNMASKLKLDLLRVSKFNEMEAKQFFHFNLAKKQKKCNSQNSHLSLFVVIHRYSFTNGWETLPNAPKP